MVLDEGKLQWWALLIRVLKLFYIAHGLLVNIGHSQRYKRIVIPYNGDILHLGLVCRLNLPVPRPSASYKLLGEWEIERQPS
jgi:hypothetical protein